MPLIRLSVLVVVLSILVTPLTTAVAQTESQDATTLGVTSTPTILPTSVDPCDSIPHVICNLPNTVPGGSTVTANVWKAMLFTTGPNRSNPQAITLGLNPATGAVLPNNANVELAFYTVVEGIPAELVVSTGLQSVVISATGGLYDFSFASSSTALEANGHYALVVRSDAAGLKWGRNANSSPIAASGFAFERFLGTDDSGENWASPSAEDNAVAMVFNLAPVIMSEQTIAYDENRSGETTLGTLLSSDDGSIMDFAITRVEGSDLVDYTSQGWFAIDAAGSLSLTTAGAGAVASNDFETTPNSFTLTISATDDVGLSSQPAEVTVSVQDAADVPAAPTALTVSVSDTTASIAFTEPWDGGSAITNYAYQLGDGAWTPLEPTDDTSPITISGLTPGSTYSLRLRAINAVGNGTPSAPVTFDVLNALTSLQAFPADGAVVMTFPAPSKVSRYDYQKVASSASDATATSAWLPVTASSSDAVRIDGLTNGLETCLRLRFATEESVGPASDVICATPIAASTSAAPPGITTRFERASSPPVARESDGSVLVTFSYSLTNETASTLSDVWIQALEAPAGTTVESVAADTGTGSLLTYAWFENRWLWKGLALAPGETRTITVTLRVEVE